MEPKSKRGRPAKEGRTRRAALSVRLRDSVREDLERHAAAARRSLSEEIEYRLEFDLLSLERLKHEWGDDMMAVAASMARMLWFIENETGKRWYEDDETFALFTAAMPKLAANYRDVVLVKRRELQHRAESIEERAARFADIAGISPPGPLKAPTPERDTNAMADAVKRLNRKSDISRPIQSKEDAGQ